MALFEEVVIWGRNRDFVTGEPLLDELRKRGFEPQIVGEIDPPPKTGGSWVLKDVRDRRRREDDGVWVSWTRPRGGEGRTQFPTRYIIETFDGRSGYDWFLACALAAAIAKTSKGAVSVDGGSDRESEAFVGDLTKDPSTQFQGPESVVDWESHNLDAEVAEDDDEEDEEEDDEEDGDLEGDDESDEDDDEDDEDDDDDADADEKDADEKDDDADDKDADEDDDADDKDADEDDDDDEEDDEDDEDDE